MGFIDSYKHLEKLCGEILNDERRISAYIDEMINISDGKFYVHTWDDDLKKLKHYRWVRNKISHEPDCNETNMCDFEDEIWLDNFYQRIMNQTDPLTLYAKKHQNAPISRTSAARKEHLPNKSLPHHELNYLYLAFLAFLLIILTVWIIKQF